MRCAGDRALSGATDQHGGAPSGAPTASERSFGMRGDADAVRPSGRIVSQAAVLSDARKGGSAGGEEARQPSGCRRSRPASDDLRVISSIDCSRSQTSREHLPSFVALGRRDTRWNGPAACNGHGPCPARRRVAGTERIDPKPMGASSRVRRKRRTRATDSSVEESPEVGDSTQAVATRQARCPNGERGTPFGERGTFERGPLQRGRGDERHGYRGGERFEGYSPQGKASNANRRRFAGSRETAQELETW